jgi:hypothetical protein
MGVVKQLMGSEAVDGGEPSNGGKLVCCTDWGSVEGAH